MECAERDSGGDCNCTWDYIKTTSELFSNLDAAIVEYNKNKSPIAGKEIKYYVDALLGCLDFGEKNKDLPAGYADVNSAIDERMRRIVAESYFGRELPEDVAESLEKYSTGQVPLKAQSSVAEQGYVVHVVDDVPKENAVANNQEEKKVEAKAEAVK